MLQLTERQMRKMDIFITFCEDLAGLSTCKRKKCGAIIFPSDFTLIRSIGYNGPPRLTDNDSCTDIEGDCGCIHAEANSLIKFGYTDDPRECVMYSTTAPCKNCASLILNCPPITRVIYHRPYRNDLGLDLLKSCNIDVYHTEELQEI